VAIVFLRPTSNPGTIERIEHRTLADGSTVDVGADTRLDVNFDATRRLVKLTHGVALFTVAKNPTKPFIVSTGAVDVQAVGTAFAVEADDRAVDVVVTEGRVSVDTAPSSSSPSTNSSRVAPVLVDSGSRLIVSLDSGTPQSLAPVALSPDQLTRQLAWREPRIRLSGTRLRDAAALFNQVNGLQIEIADRELGDMRLDGVFRADDPEGFIRLLANYDIQVRRENDRAELSRR
jgi:transmembrane sensor